MADKRSNEDEDHQEQKKMKKETVEKVSQAQCSQSTYSDQFSDVNEYSRPVHLDRTNSINQEPQASCSQRSISSQVTDAAVNRTTISLTSLDAQMALMDQHKLRCQAVIDSLRGQLSRHELCEGDQKIAVQAWMKDLREVEEKLEFPKTEIAVVGDTGDGKSSLINALLDHGSVLPTSAIRACTAAVVEVSKNTESSFVANIEFLSKEDWDNELEILLEDLTTSSGAIKDEQPKTSSDTYVSYCKVKAVYGRVDSKDQLSKLTAVTHWLGQKRIIESEDPNEFRSLVTGYIETQKPREGGQFWPIVKKVKIKLPDCDVCSSGATLVDLPGSRDSNAARDKIANEYQKTCTELWIVSSIERATDKKTASDILGERFHRQRLMDGNYGSTAFICTKTDILNVPDVVRSLELADKIKDKEDEIQQMEEEERNLNQIDSDALMELSNLKEQVSVLENDKKKFEDEFARTKDKAAEENIRTLEEKICQAKKENDQLQLNRTKALERMLDLGSKLRECRKAISAICAKARNDYCSECIKTDFVDRLREMKRRAGMLNQDDDDEDDDEDNDVKNIAKNLKVFCVSSTEYQKIRNLLTGDGPPKVFSTENDTQIPALKNYVHEIMSRRNRDSFEGLIRNLDRFVSELDMYIAESLVEPSDRASANEIIKRELDKFTQAKEMVIARLSEGIHGVFDKSFNQKIEEGASKAASEANATCAKWGATEGLQCSTYKATVKRRGVFVSPAYGYVNFNEDLAEPFYSSISVIWKKAFSTLLLEVMDNFKNDVVSKLQDMEKKIALQMMDLVKSKRHSKTVIELVHTHACDKFTETLSMRKDDVRRKQQDINRLVTPHIQDKLGDVYMLCKEQKGKGMFVKMKGYMAKAIDENRNTMFDEAKQKLLTALVALQNELVKDAGNLYEDIFTYLKREYELLLDPPSDTIKTVLEKPITEACKSMREIRAEAGLNKSLDSGSQN